MDNWNKQNIFKQDGLGETADSSAFKTLRRHRPVGIFQDKVHG